MNEQETIVTSVLSRVNSLRQTMSDEERLVLDSIIIAGQADELTLHNLNPGYALDKELIGYVDGLTIALEGDNYTIADSPPLIE